ncbi:MAG: pyridoxamine 5'-phosphate oxidase [Acidobacteriota bacterium]|nr:pyridoxamine 5'-phosphate oxidase [Acidobacteriota bacterium]
MTDPIKEFTEAFERAKKKESGDATACALATADAVGHPAVRMVLLKKVDERGFVFFTNYGSRKAQELDENPFAALCFYWPALQEQVRVEGGVARLPGEESDEYFASRSRSSRIGAWASRQSEPLASRADLLARFVHYEAKFALKTVPRPTFWGGYRLEPERIEFWFDQPSRLHDRRAFTRGVNGWTLQRLYP